MSRDAHEAGLRLDGSDFAVRTWIGLRRVLSYESVPFA